MQTENCAILVLESNYNYDVENDAKTKHNRKPLILPSTKKSKWWTNG